MFCPKCRGLMYPKDGKLQCSKCGYIKQKTGSNVVVSKQEEKDVTLIEYKDKTPFCGYAIQYWYEVIGNIYENPELLNKQV